jgi:hypothetical protein
MCSSFKIIALTNKQFDGCCYPVTYMNDPSGNLPPNPGHVNALLFQLNQTGTHHLKENTNCTVISDDVDHPSSIQFLSVFA